MHNDLKSKWHILFLVSWEPHKATFELGKHKLILAQLSWLWCSFTVIVHGRNAVLADLSQFIPILSLEWLWQLLISDRPEVEYKI